MNLKIEDIELSTESNSFRLSTRVAMDVYQEGIKLGRWSMNQVRAHQGLPPLPYGDSLFTTSFPQSAFKEI